jgi:membrane protein implicated in regulation of membrane protease activity
MVSATSTRLFQLLPIDWQAIGAIATFLAVIISFISRHLYKKRNRTDKKRNW